jgi:hypothetical protein
MNFIEWDPPALFADEAFEFRLLRVGLHLILLRVVHDLARVVFLFFVVVTNLLLLESI